MATHLADYNPEITEQSRLELVNIARWLQDNNPTAYLVGGWAVYYHFKSRERPYAKLPAPLGEFKLGDRYGFQALGSKDIDLVFENKTAKEEFEEEYCRPNDYHKRGSFKPRELVKYIGKTDVILDADLLSNSRVVRKIKVPWSYLPRHNSKLALEGSVSIQVPTKELLLLYKCVALVERTDERSKPNPNLVRLDSKIWKDANDILALHDTGINAETLGGLAKETGLSDILSDAKQIISSSYDGFGFTQYAFFRQFLEEKH